MALKTELELYTNELIKEVGDDAKSLFACQIDQARESGIPDQSLRVGAKAPLFCTQRHGRSYRAASTS